MKKPLVTINILSWNRKNNLMQTLQELQKTIYPNVEVIVVDNASTDGTPEMVEERFPDVRLIKMPRNIGIEGFNIGFKNANGEYIVILDDDAYPTPNAIEIMVREFEKDSRLGIIVFNIKDTITDKQWDVWHLPKSKSPVETINFIGCGAGIRNVHGNIEHIKFYPSCFFVYENEWDVSFKYLLNNFKIKYYPNIVAYHDITKKNLSKEQKNFRGFFAKTNKILLIIKYAPTLFKIFLLMSIIIRAVINFDWITFIAFFKAARYRLIYLKEFPVKKEDLDQDFVRKLYPFYCKILLKPLRYILNKKFLSLKN